MRGVSSFPSKPKVRASFCWLAENRINNYYNDTDLDIVIYRVLVTGAGYWFREDLHPSVASSFML